MRASLVDCHSLIRSLRGQPESNPMFEKPKRQFSALPAILLTRQLSCVGSILVLDLLCWHSVCYRALLRSTCLCRLRVRQCSGQPTAPSDEWIVIFSTGASDRSAVFVDRKGPLTLFFQLSTVLPRRTKNASFKSGVQLSITDCTPLLTGVELH